MAGRSSALRGNEIVLTVSFLDAVGDYADATDLSVNVYPPGQNPEDGATEEDAWVYGATLTEPGTGPYASAETIERVSTGRYSYTFTIPVDAEIGAAYDQWQGEIDSQDLDETFMFVIVGGGSIGTTQLYDNNMVFIKIHDTVKAEDGSELEEEYESYFTTTYTPLYSSVRRIRLDLGPLITDIPDDTINLAIFEASIDAAALSFVTTFGNAQEQSFFEFARRQFVTCMAELILLNALSGTGGIDSAGGKSKRLADLDVKYTGNAATKLDDLFDRALACKVKWEATLTSAGETSPGTSQRPSMTIKGNSDPDRPHFGRQWEMTSTFSADSQMPAANVTKGKYGKRRYRKGFSNWRWSSRFGR